MNIPNILSIIRILLVPIFAMTFLSGTENAYFYAILIFLLAGATDIVDGRLARKYNQITMLGRVLDPLADKMMVVSALACMTMHKIIPLWVVILFVCKEIFQCTSGIVLMHFLKDMPPSNAWGKLGTALFYVSIVLIVLLDPTEWIKIGLIALSFAVIFMALVSYGIRGVRLMKNLKNPVAKE